MLYLFILLNQLKVLKYPFKTFKPEYLKQSKFYKVYKLHGLNMFQFLVYLKLKIIGAFKNQFLSDQRLFSYNNKIVFDLLRVSGEPVRVYVLFFQGTDGKITKELNLHRY